MLSLVASMKCKHFHNFIIRDLKKWGFFLQDLEFYACVQQGRTVTKCFWELTACTMKSVLVLYYY